VIWKYERIFFKNKMHARQKYAISNKFISIFLKETNKKTNHKNFTITDVENTHTLRTSNMDK